MIQNYNFMDVDEKTKQLIEEACKENNYAARLVMHKSNHEDDQFLYNVLAFNENAIQGYKYCVWTYNGRGGNFFGYLMF